jgi:hypothetical protein
MWIYDTSVRLVLIAWVFTALLLVLLLTCFAAWRAGHRAEVMASAIAAVVALVSSVVGLAILATYYLSIAAFLIGVVWVFTRSSSVATSIVVAVAGA